MRITNMTQLILCLFFISIVISIDDTPTPKITFIWLEHAHSFRRMLNSSKTSLKQIKLGKKNNFNFSTKCTKNEEKIK